jgi:hypothetical protein
MNSENYYIFLKIMRLQIQEQYRIFLIMDWFQDWGLFFKGSVLIMESFLGRSLFQNVTICNERDGVP